MTICVLAGGQQAVAAEHQDDAKPVNTLTGVVVSPTDGKPIAGAEVYLAHVGEGWLYTDADGEISAYGSERRVLLFLPRRNGKTVVDTRTDADGRFRLQQFVSMTDKYTLAVRSKDHGLTLLQNVIPKDYEEKPLRTELKAPAKLILKQSTGLVSSGTYSYLSMEAESP
ncbi:MAG: carboxypeptidase regulatory-like domain-containing protein, partial [Phycisphaerae bacterium]|nr:carboxypeptidase regulatory-like domain-containing protein [Phycisphaerae bacterium]